jgi:hypothetical protein
MTQSRSRGDARDRTNPALAEALRLLKLPRHAPTDDRPPVKSAPARKIEPIRGQLDLFENEVE